VSVSTLSTPSPVPLSPPLPASSGWRPARLQPPRPQTRRRRWGRRRRRGERGARYWMPLYSPGGGHGAPQPLCFPFSLSRARSLALSHSLRCFFPAGRWSLLCATPVTIGGALLRRARSGRGSGPGRWGPAAALVPAGCAVGRASLALRGLECFRGSGWGSGEDSGGVRQGGVEQELESAVAEGGEGRDRRYACSALAVGGPTIMQTRSYFGSGPGPGARGSKRGGIATVTGAGRGGAGAGGGGKRKTAAAVAAAAAVVEGKLAGFGSAASAVAGAVAEPVGAAAAAAAPRTRSAHAKSVAEYQEQQRQRLRQEEEVRWRDSYNRDRE
jgi:hypothetical protein